MPEPCRAARVDIEAKLLKKSFFPLDQLRKYLTRQKIAEILSCSCEDCAKDKLLYGTHVDSEAFSDEIVGGPQSRDDLERTYFSVFGLLTISEHPSLIIGFLRRKCSDSFLESWVTHKSTFSPEVLEACTGNMRFDRSRFDIFVDRFDRNLPKFAVPHMETRSFRHYHAGVVLPFIDEQVIGLREDETGNLTPEGANGKVFAFKFHREYCKFRDVNPRLELVRKQITTTAPRAFLEQTNIEYVQRYKNNHIVKLIKAYGHGDTINLILPRAWTNLDHLLRNQVFGYGHKRGSLLEKANAWRQLLGIAGALKMIQGFAIGADSRASPTSIERVCIHFDLKPDNILVESEDGNWLITDFGSAALTKRRRGKTTPSVNGHFGTDAYAPPEIEDMDMHFGRAYDIWSLGCIILEVTAFMVLGYPGLVGSNDESNGVFGLDQARCTMPSWSRYQDERFFCQETPNGNYVVKEAITTFISTLEQQHATSNSSEKSKVFLGRVVELVKSMLKPNAKDRPDISEVVQRLSGALSQAKAVATTSVSYGTVAAAAGETVIGSPALNHIEILHWSAARNEWDNSRMEALENEAGYMQIYCRSPGREPVPLSFRRSDVKILPLYAFWNPNNMYSTRTWLDFSFLSAGKRAVVSNAMFGFTGNSGLADARIVQSTLTSQEIEGSYALNYLRVSRPSSLSGMLKGMLRKKKDEPILEFGTATIQIWVEQSNGGATNAATQASTAPEGSRGTRAAQMLNRDKQNALPRRIVIYLHQQCFICTVRIDVNWVLEPDEKDSKVLLFKPHPSERKRPFYASWIRPTQEEADAGYTAGVPLSPKVLQYFEDHDWFEAAEFELQFLSGAERERFRTKFLEVKQTWHRLYKASESTAPINRMPDGAAHLPSGIGTPPVPKTKARLLPTTSPRTSLVEAASISSGKEAGSRHDSTSEDFDIDPTKLMVPISIDSRSANNRRRRVVSGDV
ncbi:kinase-like protein [Pyrenochaeta sp. DS3sAY3a]|nr:kinase-like protein [Pyrenochaeta sp. DS3sAY3a]